MPKLKKLLLADGNELSHEELAAEVGTAHNLLLDYSGGTPHCALAGQMQTGWWSVEAETIVSVIGFRKSKPDVVESMLRARLLAKQCVLTARRY